MNKNAARFYLKLANDDSLDMRLPAVLKEHAERCAKARGATLSEYIIETMAQRIANELPLANTWHLSPDEQAHLLKVLATSPEESDRLVNAQARAEELFGPVAS